MNFTAGSIFASLVFGIWGVYLFRRGKDAGDFVTMCAGATLIGFPYFVENTGLLWAIGLTISFLGYRFGK